MIGGVTIWEIKQAVDYLLPLPLWLGRKVPISSQVQAV